uniref:Uncharacterized protein n=1 Tax=Anguilla anguilla TaxID=7936 RepID=A0A0E9URI3_ANGAN
MLITMAVLGNVGQILNRHGLRKKKRQNMYLCIVISICKNNFYMVIQFYK